MFRVPPNFNANTGVSNISTINYTLQDRDPMSTPRYVVEETYSTYQLFWDDKNPEAADIDASGRYCFKFPQTWFNGNLNNKSIGLRGLWNGGDFSNSFMFEFADNSTPLLDRKIQIKYLKDYSMMSILDAITLEMDGSSLYEFHVVYENNGVTFRLRDLSQPAPDPDPGPDPKPEEEAPDPLLLQNPVFRNPDPDDPICNKQWKAFNWVVANQHIEPNHVWEFEQSGSDPRDWILRFPNVWNRETLFIHASFANNSSNNLLGLLGEFYMKPSKIYEYNFNSIDFYIWTSLDGKHPVYIWGLQLIMSLSLMHNDKRVNV